MWVYHMTSDKEKFGQGWKGPYLVVEKIGDLNYRVQETQQSRKITLHVDQSKAFEHEMPPSWLNGLKCDVEVQTNM